MDKMIIIILIVISAVVISSCRKNEKGKDNLNIQDCLTVENFEKIKFFITNGNTPEKEVKKNELITDEYTITLKYSENKEFELIIIHFFDQRNKKVDNYIFGKTKKDNSVDVWAIQKMTPDKLKAELLKNLCQVVKKVKKVMVEDFDSAEI